MHRKSESNAAAAHKSVDLLALPDCRYLTERGRCSHLERTVCVGEGCPFLATTASEEARQKRWAERLCALPPEQQTAISRKYYGGTWPWKTVKKGGH